MRQKKMPLLVLLTIIILLTFILAPAVAANIKPGSFEDPVLTKSYLDSFLNNFFKQKKEQINQLDRQLNELEKKVARLEASLVLPPFPDIEGHWAYATITYLHRQDIVGGFEDGTFKPNNTVTRAQLATMLVRAKGLSPGQGASPFSDVNQAHWAHGFILAARDAGFVSGYSDGTFKPDAPVTRAEIASMLTRAFAMEQTRELIPFPDVPQDHWAKGSIEILVRAGITTGYEDNTFRPGNQATRAEVASFLARSLDPAFR